MKKAFFVFYCTSAIVLSACNFVEYDSKRAALNPPEGVHFLSRTDAGRLSQHEVRMNQSEAKVVDVDRRKGLLTILSPNGQSFTFGVVDIAPELLRSKPGDLVKVNAYSSIIYSEIDPDQVRIFNHRRVTELSNEAKQKLPGNARILTIDNTFVEVVEIHQEFDEVSLQRSDGSILRFPIRYPENFSRINSGDIIELSRLEAIVVEKL